MTVIAMPDQQWADRVGPIDGVEYVIWDLTGDIPRADEIEVLVTPYPTPSVGLERVRELPSLRLIHVLMAGYDNVPQHVPEGVTLCNASGVHDAATAEHTLALILAAQRGFPEFIRAQEQGEWLKLPFHPGLADRKVMILGYGGIGSAIARRLAPFEVELTGVATKARAGDDLVPHVHGIEELDVLLPEHDIVILILPLTPATQGLVDTGFLGKMKPGALLVNVARGKVVDTEALMAACASGRVRAAVDVTDPEPLPAGHPLFSTPGVLVVPHVGGRTDAFYPRGAALLRDQISAYVEGRPLRNVIDLS